MSLRGLVGTRSGIMFGTLAAALFLVAGLVPYANAASERPVAAEKGMVVSAQHLATDIGVDILKHGGNAIDAAVAVGYALAVMVLMALWPTGLVGLADRLLTMLTKRTAPAEAAP